MKADSARGKSKANCAFPEALRSIVQKNWDISDARYAGDYSLCIYLLKMREYYRWEQGLAFNTRLSHKAVGEWVERWSEAAAIVKRILKAYQQDVKDWKRISEWIDRIGWLRFFELTNLPFTKYHADNWRGSRKSPNASTYIRL